MRKIKFTVTIIWIKKFCFFIGGIYANDNTPNKDDIIHSPSDINLDINEKNPIHSTPLMRLKIKKIFQQSLVMMIIMRRNKLQAMKIRHMGTSKDQKQQLKTYKILESM